MKTADPQVLITRVFDAPRELVFRAWTSPEHLQRWYVPNGCEIEIKRIDFREGGELHTCIRNPEYPDCWCIGEYREIVPPERLVFTMALADEAGQRLPSVEAGKEEDWPSETTVTVTFTEADGKTTMTLHQTVSEALAKQTGAYPSWLQMLDRLEEELSRA